MPSLTTTIGVPTGPYVFNNHPRIKETYINRDKEKIKELRRKSIKDGMKQPHKKKKKREALEREKLRSDSLALGTDQASF